jgi:hypothetical protein
LAGETEALGENVPQRQRPGFRREDNIKVDRNGRGCESVDWVQLNRTKFDCRSDVRSSKRPHLLKDGEIVECLSDY